MYTSHISYDAKILTQGFHASANGRLNKYLQQLVLDLTTEITHELVVYDEPRESDGALAHGHHQCLDRTWPIERRDGYVEVRLGPAHLVRQLAPTPADLCEGSNVHPSLVNKLPFWRRICSNLGGLHLVQGQERRPDTERCSLKLVPSTAICVES